MIDPIDNNLSTKSGKSAEEYPGKLLRQKRESMKISQEEVAERLHLDIDVIKALENDNYAALPGNTYIKGYQRGYAALLGVNLNENLSFVSDSQHSEKLLPENVNYSNETKAKKFTYIWVSAVLLILMVLFTQIIQVSDINPPEQKEPVEIKEAATTTAITRQDKKVAIESNGTGKSIETGTSEPSERLKTETKVIKENKPEKFKGLVLVYEKSSWTEVYSADGKKLVYGMIKSGETIQVKGLQPYSVTLGSARAVKVRYAGKAFSTEQYIRNGMVQFVIGSSFNNKK